MPDAPNPSSPIKETATPTNDAKSKKFEGDGLPFKAKLIGMEDLTVDRDEKVCLDAMFKLKAVVRARGEHKQRIQISLTMNSVKITDDATKAQIANHEIERISFVVLDPRDNRAFGYIYNTSDDRHQFWAIKTERQASFTVLALKELFELAFEQYTNTSKAAASPSAEQQTETKQETASPVATQPTNVTETSPVVPSVQQNVPAHSPPPAPPAVEQQPVQITTPPSQQPQQEEAIVPPVTQTTTTSFLDIWGDEPVPQPAAPPATQTVTDMFSFDDPIAPVISSPPAAAPKPVNDLAAFFGSVSLDSPPVSTPSPSLNPLLGGYSNPMTFYNQPPLPTTTTNPAPPSALPFQSSTQPLLPQTSFPPPQQAVSPTKPAPTTSSPFDDLGLFGGLSTGTSGKSAKDLFNPGGGPPKTMQQLLMEKQP